MAKYCLIFWAEIMTYFMANFEGDFMANFEGDFMANFVVMLRFKESQISAGLSADFGLK